MDDLISRQVAISAICSACGKIDCDKMDKCEKLQLPPANNSEIPNSSDTISRQAAIDIFEERPLTEDDYAYCAECDHAEMCGWYPMYGCEFKSRHSTRPEIIHCRDCKRHIDGFFCQAANHHTSEFDYCASVLGAERREE